MVEKIFVGFVFPILVNGIMLLMILAIIFGMIALALAMVHSVISIFRSAITGQPLPRRSAGKSQPYDPINNEGFKQVFRDYVMKEHDKQNRH